MPILAHNFATPSPPCISSSVSLKQGECKMQAMNEVITENLIMKTFCEDLIYHRSTSQGIKGKFGTTLRMPVYIL